MRGEFGSSIITVTSLLWSLFWSLLVSSSVKCESSRGRFPIPTTICNGVKSDDCMIRGVVSCQQGLCHRPYRYHNYRYSYLFLPNLVTRRRPPFDHCHHRHSHHRLGHHRLGHLLPTTTRTTNPKATFWTSTSTSTSLPMSSMPLSSSSSSPSSWSSSSLEESARRLVHSTSRDEPNKFVCIAVAGGGGSAISALASTVGASALFLEGTVAYDRKSFQAYVGGIGIGNGNGDGDGANIRRDNVLADVDGDNFKYTSDDAATLLSRAALRRALQYRADLRDYPSCTGVGCASALVSASNHDPLRGYRPSRAYIVATRADGTAWKCRLLLSPLRRTRLEEDRIIGAVVLKAIHQLHHTDGTRPLLQHDDDLRALPDVQLTETFVPSPTSSSSAMTMTMTMAETGTETETDTWEEEEEKEEEYDGIHQNRTNPVVQSAQRIINGDVDAVLLLPTRKTNVKATPITTAAVAVSAAAAATDARQDADDKNNVSESTKEEQQQPPQPQPQREQEQEVPYSDYMVVTDPVLPLRCLVFPGSYNPPHKGHTLLARAASSAWKSAAGPGGSEAVLLEISLINADKPPLDPHAVAERAYQFFDLRDRLPSEWGLLLTNAPLFAQKVGVLRPYMSQALPGGVGGGGPSSSQFGFVIGTDTMVRILNPKYYGHSEEDMLEALREMGRRGVHFVVGGRLEQRKVSSSSAAAAAAPSSQTTGNGDGDGGGGNDHQNTTTTATAKEDPTRFVSGHDELQRLPKDVQKLFTIVREDDFRVDISSTEIRRQQQKSQKKN